MISFTLTGTIRDRPAPIMITNFRELATLLWFTICIKDPNPHAKIEVVFGIVMSMFLASEVGERLSLLPFLRLLQFEKAVLEVHAVEGSTSDGRPWRMEYSDIQAHPNVTMNQEAI